MVTEKEIVSFMKRKIKEHINNTKKPFRANSIIGCFNRDKAKREWFKQRYVCESQYLQFIHKHRRDFKYDKKTGDITVNNNPCVKPDYFNELAIGPLADIKHNADKVVLLVKILDYLREESGEIDNDRNKCRGEVGAKLDDLLDNVKEYAKEAFRTSDASELRFTLKNFCVRENESYIHCHSRTEIVTLKAFGDRRKFDETFVEEAMEFVEELAKNMVVNAIKAILRIDQSSAGKWKSYEELSNYLNKQLSKLAPLACNGELRFDEDNVKNVVDEEGGDDILRDVKQNMIALKSRVLTETTKSNEVLLFEERGETLREVEGRVTKVDSDSHVFITGEVSGLSVKFVGDLMTGEHAAVDVSPNDKVVFNARYDRNKWNAIKILSVERPDGAGDAV